MPFSVEVLTNLLLGSVRDPAGAFHSHALTLDLLARCETILSDALKLQLSTTTLTLSPFQNFYDLSGYLPSAVSIIDIQENARSLSRVESLDDIASLNRSWHQEVRDRCECWCQVGETYFAIYPARQYAFTLDVIHTTRAGPYLSLPNDETIIDEDSTNLLLLVTRILLQLRARQFDALKDSLETFEATYLLTESK